MKRLRTHTSQPWKIKSNLLFWDLISYIDIPNRTIIISRIYFGIGYYILVLTGKAYIDASVIIIFYQWFHILFGKIFGCQTEIDRKMIQKTTKSVFDVMAWVTVFGGENWIVILCNKTSVKKRLVVKSKRIQLPLFLGLKLIFYDPFLVNIARLEKSKTIFFLQVCKIIVAKRFYKISHRLF